MQNTSIKSMTMTDRMSTLVLGITHYDQNSYRIRTTLLYDCSMLA